MNIVFVCSNNTHIQMFLPVALQLSQKEPSDHIYFLSLGEMIGYVMDYRMFNHEARYRLIKLRDETAPYLYSRLVPIIYIYVFAHLSKMQSILFNIQPSISVFGNDFGLPEKILIRKCRRMGIRTLLVQDGILYENEKGSRHYKIRRLMTNLMEYFGLEYLGSTLYGQGGCDYIAAMGKFYKELFISRDVQPERVVMTGQPRYDNLPPKSPASKNLQVDMPKATILTTGLLKQIKQKRVHEEFFQELLIAIEEIRQEFRSNVEIILKLHPADDRAYIEEEMKKRGLLGIRIYQTEIDIHSIILQSSFIVTTFTTAVLESILLDTPVILTCVCFQDSDMYKTAAQFGLPVARSREELRSMLNRCKVNEISHLLAEQKNAIRNLLHRDPQEPASKSIAHLIFEICGARLS